MRVITILLGAGLVGMALMCCAPLEPEPLEIEVKGEVSATGEIMMVNETTHDTVIAENAITDAYLDACITFMSTSDIEKVGSIAFIHKWMDHGHQGWDTTVIGTIYNAGGYDTTNYVQWRSGYKTGADYDTLKFWYLLPGIIDPPELDEAYATEIHTLGMTGGDSVTVYWAIYHTAKP